MFADTQTNPSDPAQPCRDDGNGPLRIRAAQNRLPDERVIAAVSETFKAMSDPTRVRIIAALAGAELCVCDLADLLNLTGSAVSHQLRLLRAQRLVKHRRDGKTIFYTLDDEHIERLLAECIRHVT